jgi:hypothetical protein
MNLKGERNPKDRFPIVSPNYLRILKLPEKLLHILKNILDPQKIVGKSKDFGSRYDQKVEMRSLEPSVKGYYHKDVSLS